MIKNPIPLAAVLAMLAYAYLIPPPTAAATGTGSAVHPAIERFNARYGAETPAFEAYPAVIENRDLFVAEFTRWEEQGLGQALELVKEMGAAYAQDPNPALLDFAELRLMQLQQRVDDAIDRYSDRLDRTTFNSFARAPLVLGLHIDFIRNVKKVRASEGIEAARRMVADFNAEGGWDRTHETHRVYGFPIDAAVKTGPSVDAVLMASPTGRQTAAQPSIPAPSTAPSVTAPAQESRSTLLARFVVFLGLMSSSSGAFMTLVLSPMYFTGDPRIAFFAASPIIFYSFAGLFFFSSMLRSVGTTDEGIKNRGTIALGLGAMALAGLVWSGLFPASAAVGSLAGLLAWRTIKLVPAMLKFETTAPAALIVIISMLALGYWISGWTGSLFSLGALTLAAGIWTHITKEFRDEYLAKFR